MNKLLTKASYWNVLSVVAFSLIFYVLNTFFAEVPISFIHIITSGGLFGFYYIVLFIAIWKIFVGGNVGLGLLILYFSVAFLVYYGYSLFYKWLPAVGIDFHYPGKKFNLLVFQQRLVRGYLATLTIAGGMVAVIRVFQNRGLLRMAELRRQELAYSVRELQERVHAKYISPHFIEGIMAISLGQLTHGNQKEYFDNLQHLADLMRYAIEMQDSTKSQAWSIEWTYFKKLIYLVRAYYGKDTIRLNVRKEELEVCIPIGLLLMPLENAIKYGAISSRSPIGICLTATDKQWTFSIINRFSHKKREGMVSGKTGIALMKERISLDSLPIRIMVVEDGDMFVFKMTGQI
ncbi:hypothetical protein [Sphingobacterium sp. LRF_L2]|uniref:hypothetical protein n=1 Tax=Sphingobacterium sp. LRF_L2 TaxID=3369421 RepID=UPI003F5F85A3